MIRINLLPTKAAVGPTPARIQLIVAGGVILLSLIGVFSWAHSLNARIRDYEDKIAKQEAEYKKVENADAEFKRIKKLNSDLRGKLKVIEDIEKARTGPVWFMDQLADAVSRFPVKTYANNKVTQISCLYMDDKIFLKSLKVNPNGGFNMKGIAINNTYLVAFLNNLECKKDVFANVKLIVSKSTTYQKALVKEFEITGTVKLRATPRIGGPTAGKFNLAPDAQCPCEPINEPVKISKKTGEG